MNPFKSQKILVLVFATILMGTLPACNDNSAGDKIEEAGKDAGRAVEDAAD